MSTWKQEIVTYLTTQATHRYITFKNDNFEPHLHSFINFRHVHISLPNIVYSLSPLFKIHDNIYVYSGRISKKIDTCRYWDNFCFCFFNSDSHNGFIVFDDFNSLIVRFIHKMFDDLKVDVLRQVFHYFHGYDL